MTTARSAAATAFWVRQRAKLDARFWDRVDKSAGPDACWPWTGSRQTPNKATGSGGYGFYWRHRHVMYAHRRALELELGRPIGDGLFACHTCDNPPCCNPAHLFEGTSGDNVRDAIQKGRVARLREWLCPDCGAHVAKVSRKAQGRCGSCVTVAQKAKRRRAYVRQRSDTCQSRKVPAGVDVVTWRS